MYFFSYSRIILPKQTLENKCDSTTISMQEAGPGFKSPVEPYCDSKPEFQIRSNA